MANELAHKGSTDHEKRGHTPHLKGRIKVGRSEDVPEQGRLSEERKRNIQGETARKVFKL